MSKKITEKRLENIALFYLQRYESCSSKLRDTLKRRIRRAKVQGIEVPDEANQWIENVIKKMIDLGYLDDKRYTQNTFRHLQNDGKSTRFITTRLKLAGIEPEILKDVLEEQEKTIDELDIASARKLVDKKKLGFHRPEGFRALLRQKDLAVLGRAGFSYEIACKALDSSAED